MIELVVATRNPGKVREIAAALEGLDLALRALQDFPEAPEIVEDGQTFLDNALKKARAVARHTHRYALADDSGLRADALSGAPGVFSARYAGAGATDEMNNRKLLAALKEVPPEKRTARFACVIAVAAPDGRTLTVEGTCEGVILSAPRGNLGFGYDPLFLFPPLNQTFSELPIAEKLQVSHRGRALSELRKKLGSWLIEMETADKNQ